MKAAEQHPVNFADCYVLTNNRTKTFIHSFLHTFLPNRQEVTKQYQIPQFSENPILILRSAEDFIDYLEENETERHAIYWLNKEAATLRGAMCIFTSDGKVIVGVYCETRRPDTTIENHFLKRLMEFSNSKNGLIEYEQPAPQDTAAFLERLKMQTHNKFLK